jgi:hypothetical protein
MPRREATIAFLGGVVRVVGTDAERGSLTRSVSLITGTYHSWRTLGTGILKFLQVHSKV